MATITAVTVVTPKFAGWLDVPGMWSAAAIGQYCSEISRIGAAHRTPEHIARWGEMQEIAAQVHAATSDDPDPHGDLSWRDSYELPY